MKKKSLIFGLASMCLLTTGCDVKTTSEQSLANDVVQINYQAKTDEQGDCTPEYVAITNKSEDGSPENQIYIIYGETEYFNPQNVKIGEIPFQVKMYKTNMGMPSEGTACHDLYIKITLEECKYSFQSNRSDCPAVEINGASAFAGIELVGLD